MLEAINERRNDMSKRDNAILECLTESGRMEVSLLAQQLGVSQVTVRKDLDSLERRGIVRREHGFALLGGADDINNRLAFHYEEKKRIAKLAAALVSPGETVMIESGSCCTLLAEQIGKTVPGATIVTNSAFIASYVRHLNVHIVLLGGDFQNDAQVMVGPVLKSCIAQFYTDKLFIGIDGYSSRLGFSGNNHLRVQAVHDMAEHASKVVVLSESRKFLQNGVVPMGINDRVKTVVTDAALPAETAAELVGMGVEVQKAEI